MTTPNVYTAIAAVTAELAQTGIAKDRKNDQQGYKFRGIDDVYNALAPVLSRHKLCMLPRMISRDVVERQSTRGGALFYVTVEAEFDLVSAVDGSKHTIRTCGEAMDSGDKATNKAMSAAYKYAAMQAFCIPTEGDNDADATTHEVRPVVRAEPDVSAERQAVVRRVADACIEKHAAGNLWGCYEEAAAITDSDERLMLWAMLKPHSRVRACIKEFADAARAEAERKAKAAQAKAKAEADEEKANAIFGN